MVMSHDPDDGMRDAPGEGRNKRARRLTDASRTIGDTMESQNAEESTLVGLCAHCELRESCKRPRPQGGIWSCTEYQ